MAIKHDQLTNDDLLFIKAIVDTLHDNFLVNEVEIDGILYRWPFIFHDENCRRTSIKKPAGNITEDVSV